MLFACTGQGQARRRPAGEAKCPLLAAKRPLLAATGSWRSGGRRRGRLVEGFVVELDLAPGAEGEAGQGADSRAGAAGPPADSESSGGA